MNGPADELERLVRAARGERPRDGARERTLERLLAPDVAPAPNTTRRAVVRVAATIAAVAAIAAIMAVVLRRSDAKPPIAAEPLPPSTATPHSDGAAPTSVASPLVPVPDLPAIPEPVMSATPSSRPAPPRPSAASAQPLSLEEETRALEAVQRELRAGRGAAALTLLDRYDRAAHGGGMTSEARLLRIEALRSIGNVSAATRAAREFVRAYPNSPLVERARRYLAQADADDASNTPDAGELPSSKDSSGDNGR